MHVMSGASILRLGSVKDVRRFQEHLRSLGLEIPCDEEIVSGSASPLLLPLERSGIKIGNRIAVNPMEGWDGTPDGHPSALTFRRWQNFGRSGAKLIWGCEAVAVSMCARANPNQLVMAPHTRESFARLRAGLIQEHCKATGSDNNLVIGVQLTHSGRYCRPHAHNWPEPQIAYRHPILDRKLSLPDDYPVLTDTEIQKIVEEFVVAAHAVCELGFDFVDIKHCHGYLGHELLSAHTREGKYGGSFENRTRFLREIVGGIRATAPALQIGVRLSAFDTVPFRPDPARASNGKLGPGIPEEHRHLIPYRWGFGVDALQPTESDLSEPLRLLSLLEDLKIPLVNMTAGSPYYNPHLQRPALYPPSDGYLPPEDPLIAVARQLNVTRALKRRFPNLIVVGTAYSYLQDFLPYVAQSALTQGWVDVVGLGRMTLTYPEILLDAAAGRPLQHKRVCRTFSDCTTAPRNGLPSGCYPLDSHYKNSAMMVRLAVAKAKR
jgi:NADPH2 dehydrogenase